MRINLLYNQGTEALKYARELMMRNYYVSFYEKFMRHPQINNIWKTKAIHLNNVEGKNNTNAENYLMWKSKSHYRHPYSFISLLFSTFFVLVKVEFTLQQNLFFYYLSTFSLFFRHFYFLTKFRFTNRDKLAEKGGRRESFR
jgi:hypothetical protein